jgi:hypothetical protein
MGLQGRKRLNRVAIGAVLWGLVVVVGLICHQVVLDRQLEVISAEEYLTQAQLDRLIEDQRLISESGVFPEGSQSRDAGPLLNPHIKLHGGTVAQQTAIDPPWWGGAEVYAQVKGPRGKGRPAPDARPWLVAPETMPAGDLSLTAALLEFDHWETSGPGGRYAEYLQTAAHPFHADSPIPNLVDLQTLARLRLARGLASPDGEDMLPALRQVRHLARLTYSTEHLIASMVANAILSIEKRGYERAVDQGLIGAEAWRPAEDSLRQAIRRVGFGSVMVVAGWTVPDDALDQLAAADLRLFSLCGALNELTFLHHGSFPAWDTLPGEQALHHHGDRASRLLTDNPQCRVPVARAVLADPSRMNLEEYWRGIDEGSSEAKQSRALLRIPFLRVHLLIEVQRGHPYRQYGQTPAMDWPGATR